MEDAELWRGSFSRFVSNLQMNSDYFQWIQAGITDSDGDNEFSNEKFKFGARASSSTRGVERGLDNHLLLKYDLIQTGLYDRVVPGFDSHGIVQLIYTHYTYLDGLEVLIESQLRNLGTFEKTYVAINRIPDNSELSPGMRNFNINWILYEDSLAYTDRLGQILDSIEEEFVFFTHEDMPLLTSPKTDYLFEAHEQLANNSALSCARFIRVSPLHWPLVLERFGLRAFAKNPKFSKWQVTVQPTLWKTRHFLELVKSIPNLSVWDFELQASKGLSRHGRRALQPRFSGERRGKHHRDSIVFPYVATAIVKGHWNTAEYPELLDILSSCGISPSRRGQN